jgi:hypothetical protein
MPLDQKTVANRPNAFHQGSGSVPIPDPTERTTEALLREIAALKELVTTRLDAMDKAMSIFSENLTRAPTEVDKQIGHLKSLMEATFRATDEKFNSIQTQFLERDVRVEQTARDTKVAVDAALSAQKEQAKQQNESFGLSIAKSETATVKQIDQQSTLIQSTTSGLSLQINDIKDRLTRIEGKGAGMQSSWAIVVGAIGILGILFAIASRFIP